ncbi:F-box/kelch-repeat protein At3g06240-like [Cornus florida]|uniref:F-box/kelch-repeat protein At3g06240-like n=1 Tax=Cornus florida TaxID=4283 RepID=UPI00289B6C81|nr:F-box/kelch-repeat protein At3g06240-like [Cornus florida]
MAMEKDELSPILPYDLMTDVLSRLPVKSIVRFKCVSKSWLALFAHPHFVSLHLTRSRNSKLVLAYSLDFLSNFLHRPNTLNDLFVLSCDGIVEAASDYIDGGGGALIDIVPPHERKQQVYMAGSCRGLVLCHTRRRCALSLVNPSTREFMRLPISQLHKTSFRSVGLGYDPSADDYKVVQLSTHPFPRKTDMNMTLYSLKSNSWRRIRDFPFRAESMDSGVFVNGNFHWFNPDMSKIVSFHLAEEKFGDVPLPDDIIEAPLIGVVRGCLCILSRAKLITAWVMNEYGIGESWTKFELDLDAPIYVTNTKPLNFSNNDEILFAIPDTQEFVVCNLKERTSRHMELINSDLEWSEAETCLESIVSPQEIIKKAEANK